MNISARNLLVAFISVWWGCCTQARQTRTGCVNLCACFSVVFAVVIACRLKSGAPPSTP